MSDIVECPSCTRKLRVPDAMTNQRVKCPSCGTTFDAAPVIPTAPDLPAVAMQEPVVETAAKEFAEPAPTPQPREAEPLPPAVRPGQVQAIAVMTLVGGILAIVNFLLVGAGSGFFCCLWPGLYYGLVFGIMAIVKGSALLGQNAHLEPAPRGIAIMQIINVINFDIPNCVMGILTLTFLSDPNVKKFFRE